VARGWSYWVSTTGAVVSAAWLAYMVVTAIASPAGGSGMWTYVMAAAFLGAVFAAFGAAAREWGLVAAVGAGLAVVSLFSAYFALAFLPSALVLLLSAALGAVLD
jgi:hypothetical protein